MSFMLKVFVIFFYPMLFLKHMAPPEKIGCFGGTFNPVHYAHLRVAEEIRSSLSLNKVLFIPSYSPPLKTKELASPQDRFKMVEMAIEGNPSFEISYIKYEKTGFSYTADTLKKVKDIHTDKELFFIMGIDTFLELPKWHKPEFIVDYIDLIVISKPKWSFQNLLRSPYIKTTRSIIDKFEKSRSKTQKISLFNNRSLILLKTTLMDISASRIRELIRKKRSIKYLLPEKIESYIISKGLYK